MGKSQQERQGAACPCLGQQVKPWRVSTWAVLTEQKQSNQVSQSSTKVHEVPFYFYLFIYILF